MSLQAYAHQDSWTDRTLLCHSLGPGFQIKPSWTKAMMALRPAESNYEAVASWSSFSLSIDSVDGSQWASGARPPSEVASTRKASINDRSFRPITVPDHGLQMRITLYPIWSSSTARNITVGNNSHGYGPSPGPPSYYYSYWPRLFRTAQPLGYHMNTHRRDRFALMIYCE